MTIVALSSKIQTEEIRDTENISEKEFMSKNKYFTMPTRNHSLSKGNHRLCSESKLSQPHKKTLPLHLAATSAIPRSLIYAENSTT